MAGDQEQNPSRKVRADAERNRAVLLATAKAAFAARGAAVSMDEIARSAGVGAGTLYRHFPNRDALIEAVYLNETRQLAEAANELVVSHAPIEALREWMRLFVDYIATKRVMAEALGSLAGGTSALYATTASLISVALMRLIDRAVASGDIRLELEPLDLLRALSGVANTSGEAKADQSAKRLIDVLLAGLGRPDADR